MPNYTLSNQKYNGSSYTLTISKSTLNAWAASNIPDHATITSVVLTCGCTKDAGTLTGDIEVTVAGAKLIDKSGAINSWSEYGVNLELKDYVTSGGINAGDISGDIVIYLGGLLRKTNWYINNLTIVYNYTAHGHNYTTEISRTPSTCCKKGSVTKKCSCGTTQTTELALDPSNHSGGTEVRNAKAATCTATGYTGDTYCKGCGVKISSGSTIAKKSHTEQTIPAVPATCDSTGLTAGKKCSVCGTIITAQQTVPKLGHNYKDVVTQPTENSSGYTTHTCINCGDSCVDSYIHPVRVILLDSESVQYVAHDGSLTFEAPEVEGYEFIKWSDGNTERSRTVKVTDKVTYQAIYERIFIPIKVNKEQVSGVYVVPATKTIVYVISGTIPTVKVTRDSVDKWHFLVSNSIPENGYPLEKMFVIKDGIKTRIF